MNGTCVIGKRWFPPLHGRGLSPCLEGRADAAVDTAVPGNRDPAGRGAGSVVMGVGCQWRHFPHWAVGKPYGEWTESPGRVSSFTSCSPFPLCHLWNEIQLGPLRFTGLHVFSALPVHKFMIALLGAKHQDICFSACGVLLNLTVDRDRRLILKEGGGIKK